MSKEAYISLRKLFCEAHATFAQPEFRYPPCIAYHVDLKHPLQNELAFLGTVWLEDGGYNFFVECEGIHEKLFAAVLRLFSKAGALLPREFRNVIRHRGDNVADLWLAVIWQAVPGEFVVGPLFNQVPEGVVLLPSPFLASVDAISECGLTTDSPRLPRQKPYLGITVDGDTIRRCGFKSAVTLKSDGKPRLIFDAVFGSSEEGMTRHEIFDAVWGTNAEVQECNVDTQIRNANSALGPLRVKIARGAESRYRVTAL